MPTLSAVGECCEPMRHDEFQQRAKQWLSTYKRDVLGVEEDGIWLRNRKAYPHILPQEKYQLNILPSFRDEFWKWFPSQRIQLHSDFHHLNSSQAVCFNLFFPMLRNDGQGLWGVALSHEDRGNPDKAACFRVSAST